MEGLEKCRHIRIEFPFRMIFTLENLCVININANDLFVKEIHYSLHTLLLSHHIPAPLYDGMINHHMPFIHREIPDWGAHNTLLIYHSLGDRSINGFSLPHTVHLENLIS
jgi:hypothetical protein